MDGIAVMAGVSLEPRIISLYGLGRATDDVCYSAVCLTEISLIRITELIYKNVCWYGLAFCQALPAEIVLPLYHLAITAGETFHSVFTAGVWSNSVAVI